MQYTLRNIPKTVDKALRERARRDGKSLNELEPSFPWAKCAVAGTQKSREVAYLSLPTRCASSLPFTATATSWQQPGAAQAQAQAQAVNRDPGGPAVPLSGCGSLTSSP